MSIMDALARLPRNVLTVLCFKLEPENNGNGGLNSSSGVVDECDCGRLDALVSWLSRSVGTIHVRAHTRTKRNTVWRDNGESGQNATLCMAG